MSSNSSTLEKITNGILAPLRIIKDKSADALKAITSSNKSNIERLFPKKNLLGHLSDHLVFFSEPTLVYPNLYLGSVYNAVLWQTLVNNNIKYIINVSNEITNWYPDHIEYYQIPIKDNNNESMQPYFDESFNKIEEFLSKGDGNVLVHCYFGASRSATIIIEYLRRKTGKPVDEIIQELKAMRSVINPTHQFVQDLNDSANPHNETPEINYQYETNLTEQLNLFKELNDSVKMTDVEESIEQEETIQKIIESEKLKESTESKKSTESEELEFKIKKELEELEKLEEPKELEELVELEFKIEKELEELKQLKALVKLDKLEEAIN